MSNDLSPSIIVRKRLAAQAVWMTLFTSAALTPHFLHFSRSTRNSRFVWPLMRKTPTFSTPWTVCSLSFTLSARRSSSSRSGPKILTELSPLTPDSASMTLSRMFCEKFQSTPGIRSFSSAFISLTSSSLVRGRLAPKTSARQPVCSTTAGHSFCGRSGTKNSVL